MTEQYGRSPALDAAQDVYECNLTLHRLTMYGPLPAGVTVYRTSKCKWRVLPDPEAKS